MLGFIMNGIECLKERRDSSKKIVLALGLASLVVAGCADRALSPDSSGAESPSPTEVEPPTASEVEAALQALVKSYTTILESEEPQPAGSIDTIADDEPCEDDDDEDFKDAYCPDGDDVWGMNPQPVCETCLDRGVYREGRFNMGISAGIGFGFTDAELAKRATFTVEAVRGGAWMTLLFWNGKQWVVRPQGFVWVPEGQTRTIVAQHRPWAPPVATLGFLLGVDPEETFNVSWYSTR